MTTLQIPLRTVTPPPQVTQPVRPARPDAIEVQDLDFYYGQKRALEKITIGIQPNVVTAFGSPFWAWNPTEPIAALPLQIFQYAISPYEEWHRLAWASSLVLIALVLAMNLSARFLIRSPYRER